MELKPIAHYAKAVRPELPEAYFQPVPSRLLWVPVHLAIWLGLGAFLHLASPHWAFWIPGVLLIGHSVGCFGFLGHEILHGHMTKNTRIQNILGQFCFSPYLLVEEFWRAWHNRTHHGNTQVPEKDPDLMPSVEEWEQYPALRFTSRFMVGWRNPLTFLALSFGFISHQSMVLFTKSRQQGMLTDKEFNRCRLRYFAILAFWLSFLPLLGFWHFLALILIPIGMGNILVMSYIMTNHNLNPRTRVNDPLVNSLSVFTGPVFSKLHMNFGYHVEHHVFPNMSPAFAPKVSEKIKEKWPELYQGLPLWKALWLLMMTPRIYEDDVVLVDPKTSRRWVTLGAKNLAPQSLYLTEIEDMEKVAEDLVGNWTFQTAHHALKEAFDRKTECFTSARLQAGLAAQEIVRLQGLKLALAQETARTMVTLQKQTVREYKKRWKAAEKQTGLPRQKWEEARTQAQESFLAQKVKYQQIREAARELVAQQRISFLTARRMARISA